MIPDARQSFNERFTPAGYERLLDLLAERCGGPVAFRVCETPCFLPGDLLNRLAADGFDLIRQLTESSDYRLASEAAIPPRWRVPDEPEHPLFVQVDFGLVRGTAGGLEPRLVEIQGFPSLYAFQPVLAQAYLDAYGLEDSWSLCLGGLDAGTYRQLLRDAIVGDHDPQQVILLDVDPGRQKTRCDFVLTEQLTGIRTVCLTEVRRRGDRLFYQRDGVETPVRRVYNRCIVDEIERRRIEPPFDYRQALDIEWAGHPNHYFRISKFSIPYLRHSSVPRTWFVDELPEIPADLENYVLKPLYSFAGHGVVVGPERASIDAIPQERRHEFILQERVSFERVIDTPHGLTQMEIRLMYIWPDDELEPRAVCSLLRTGRGQQMGVDHNKNMAWVGASAALSTSATR